MSLGDVFLAAILADTDDDVTRLVYADWCEENDDQARAEFIRLQIRMEHMQRPNVEWDEAAIREVELRKEVFEPFGLVKL